MAEVIRKEVAILGGGLAGLSLAHELAGENLSCAVLEKEGAVGGLARTFRKDGFGYDIGGHCFHTSLPQVKEKFFHLLQDQVLTVTRQSTIMLNGNRIKYPLTLRNAAISLGAARALKVLAECLLVAFRSPNGNHDSFDQWMVRHFGKTLFEMYFQPYTEKVWGLPCSQLSADWASQRISFLNLPQAVRSMFRSRDKLPQTNSSSFYYAPQGIGQLAETLARRTRGDTLLLLNSQVREVMDAGEEWKQVRVQAGKNQEQLLIRARHIVSTIPLPELIAALRPSPPEEILNAAQSLGYRGVLLVFLVINRPRVTDDTWTYFPEKDLTFGRIHEPGNWSPELKQPGQTSLCLEVFCDEGDQVWAAADEELIARVLEELERLHWISRREVTAAEVRRISHAYPVYRLGYRERLLKVRDYLQTLKGVHLTGRTGSFLYQNMDQVWDASMKLGRSLLTNQDHCQGTES